jgi:hypothetical protein
VPTIPEIEARYLPQIAAARAAAEERRDLAWLPEYPQHLCGFPIRPLSLSDFLALRLAGNAYVCAVPPPADPVDAAAFWAAHAVVVLWRLSPDYSPSPAAREAFLRRPALLALDGLALHAAVEEFLRETFADRPLPVKKVGGADVVPPTVAASFAACWIHELAEAYGWPPATVLALPLAQIFQIRQLLRLSATLAAGKTPLPAGDEADRLEAAAFAEIAALS